MGNYVVVIDDSPTVRKIMEVCLCRQGYQVKSFPGGIEAILWLEAFRECVPGLIFVDIEMPKMDGYAVIQRLRAQSVFRKVPFVIISRHDGFIDKLKGKVVGATDHLTKPFEVANIVSVAQRHLGVVAIPRQYYI